MKTDMKSRYFLSTVLPVLLTAGLFPLGQSVLLPSAEASGPWNGRGIAFTFSSDDGNRPDNLAWADLFTASGLSFTMFIPSSWVGWTDRNKLTAADLIDLHLRGIEIASHGKTHVRLTELSDAQMLDELVGSCADLQAFVGGDYLCRTIAYPAHAHDLHVMAVVDSLGFTAARDGGSNVLGYPDFSLGKSTWAETSLFELPITVVASYLVGTGNSFSETETRAAVQQLLALPSISTQHYWINVYAHTLADIDVQHMTWVLDEMQKGDVWIENFAAVADYYRQGHGLPVPVGVVLPTPVLLSRFAATSHPGEILLEWASSGDTGFSGFHVHRSTMPETGYVRVTSGLIPPASSYRFVDGQVSPGVTYYYRLEALDRAGTSQFFGPVSARVEPGGGGGPGTVLGQASPNPSPGGASTIPFSLSQPGYVTVRIVNLSGRKVRTLVDGVMGAGDQSIQWDGLDDRGDNVPAGIYLYELLTPGFKATRKLVRLR